MSSALWYDAYPLNYYLSSLFYLPFYFICDYPFVNRQSNYPSLWKSTLDSLVPLIKASGKKTRYGQLKHLHSWYINTLPKLLVTQNKLEHQDLEKLVGFKLTRGKMRPLMNRVKSNSPRSVEQASTLAIGIQLLYNIVWIYIYTYIYISMYVCTYVCMYVCMD